LLAIKNLIEHRTYCSGNGRFVVRIQPVVAGVDRSLAQPETAILPDCVKTHYGDIIRLSR
jgi:hypothetical protein